MERTVIIANTSNMPVAAREASIYTAITVAEYFRDQGLHVALMADSTSRWAEALREVSGRLGELPGEAGYPAYLSSRLAEFYERAARVHALCGREGSVTIIGAVSPPAGDFSEPVTLHTKRYVRCFWALDRQRAQARFYPAIHPLLSYGSDAQALADWWKRAGNPDWLAQRQRTLELLEAQAHLERMARIVGRDALPAPQQARLLCADLVNEGFLRQSSFSPVDRYCSPARQAAMLSVLLHFIDRAEAAVAAGVAPARLAALPLLRQLQRLGEEFGEDDLLRLRQLPRQVDFEFDQPATGGRPCRLTCCSTTPSPASRGRCCSRAARRGVGLNAAVEVLAPDAPGRLGRVAALDDETMVIEVLEATAGLGLARHAYPAAAGAAAVRRRPRPARPRVRQRRSAARRRPAGRGARTPPHRGARHQPGLARAAARLHRDRRLARSTS